MPVAEGCSKSQAAHCKALRAEKLVLLSKREGNLLALIKTLHAYFKHSAMFTNAHPSVANSIGMELMRRKK
jgi:hypothetical protein